MWLPQLLTPRQWPTRTSLAWRGTCILTFGLSHRWKELIGKQAVLAAVKPLVNLIKSIKVHAKFGSEDQAMLTYGMEFAEPMGICRTAALMSFKEGLIARSELFFDARPFIKK